MLKVVENKEKIVDFKTRQKQFENWLKKVVEVNCKEETVEHAVIVFEKKDKDGNTKLEAARFNSTVEEFEKFSLFLQDSILYSKIDGYLRQNIGDYLQYIEE